MNEIKIYTLLFLSLSCTSNKTIAKPKNKHYVYAEIIMKDSSDILIPITNDNEFKFGSNCAFKNIKGDTVIPFGIYDNWDNTDTLRTFAIVNKTGRGPVGINRAGEILFEAFLYGDCISDEFSEGHIRIRQNNKIGFANKNGEVVIKPSYEYAYPFENGKAKVTYKCEFVEEEMEHFTPTSSNWFYIDKYGNKVI